jgi:transposase-like protein
VRKTMERNAEVTQLDAAYTRCWCPICETYHDCKMHWIGRGTPRKFCTRCKQDRQGLFKNPELVESISKFYRDNCPPPSQWSLRPEMSRAMSFGRGR